MNVYGRSTVSEFLGDRIVYRNLAPYDPRLPGLEAICREAGISGGLIPRKHELEYARVIAYLLQQARQLDQPLARIQRLAFIGDTRMSDGTAFENLCQVASWPGRAFIGAEDAQPEVLSAVQTSGGQTIYLANRWSALDAFDHLCAEQGFPVDEATALVLDLDKTTIGARGRNAKTIDGARVQAVKDTVAGLLGKDFNGVAFQAAYSRLDNAEFHPFTTDNQDYLAYVCLILGSGLFDLDDLVDDFHSGRLASFQQFICQVDERKQALPPALVAIHDQIFGRVQAGDPTPFKAFRRNEYRVTVSRMGCLDDDAPVEDLLKGEIVITQEVRALALDWAKRGALVFGLSDKPDEASIPTPELAEQGFQPIHATPTHIVGA